MQIAERIRKLIAHEQSARSIGNVVEAEAFAAKIQTLLLEHKLTMSDVEMKADPLGHAGEDATRPTKRAQPWNHMLAVAAARACLCEAVGTHASNSIVFIGRSQDRAVAISIWRFLSDLALQLLADDLPKIGKRSRMHPLRARERYLKGFATAIMMRLHREKQRVVQEAGRPGIVRVQNEETALATYQATALKTKSTNLAPTRDSLAFRAGFARGTEAPLRKQHTLEAGR